MSAQWRDALLVEQASTTAAHAFGPGASTPPFPLPGLDAQVVAAIADATQSRHDDQPPRPACRVVLRMLDGLTGLPLGTVDGTGEAEDRSQALAQAWDGAGRRLLERLQARAPEAAVVAIDGDGLRLSAGADQGLLVGQTFAVHAQGDRVRSRVTGGVVVLPGRWLARVRIERVWPKSVPVGAGLVAGHASSHALGMPLEGGAAGGALARVIQGRLTGLRPEDFTVPLAGE